MAKTSSFKKCLGVLVTIWYYSWDQPSNYQKLSKFFPRAESIHILTLLWFIYNISGKCWSVGVPYNHIL